MVRRGKKAKKNEERRTYTQEFKTEAVALAEKKEKPVSKVAKDLGLNENVLYRWIRQTREAADLKSEGTNIRVFPGHGRARDAELIRLRKENKALRNANEILKKRRSPRTFGSTHRKNPSDGVPVHTRKYWTVQRQGDDRSFRGKPGRVLQMA
jgi:transposase